MKTSRYIRVSFFFVVAKALRVPVKIRDTFYGGNLDYSMPTENTASYKPPPYSRFMMIVPREANLLDTKRIYASFK